jgi:hypothetical protein
MIELSIIEGPHRGKSFKVESDEVYLGRSPDNDVQIKDIMVSRKHLKVSKKDNKYIIMDLQSSNGTIVDNKQINPGIEIEIGEGIPIRIGASVFLAGVPYEKELQNNFNSTIPPVAKSSIYEAVDEKRAMTLENNMDLMKKISNLFKERLDLNEALDKTLSYILALLKRVDRAFLILNDHKKRKISSDDVIFKSRSGFLDSDMNYNEDIVDQVIRDKNAVIISDVYSEDDIGFSDTLKLTKTGSVICLPLMSYSRLQGVMYFDTIEKTHGFRKEDLLLLMTLGTPIALAIENSILHDRINN